jgi:hypothetical protein
MLLSGVRSQVLITSTLAIRTNTGKGTKSTTLQPVPRAAPHRSVGNGGPGELGDYMTLGLDQSGTATVENILLERQLMHAAELTRLLDAAIDVVHGHVWAAIPGASIVSTLINT